MAERFTPFYEWVAKMVIKEELKLSEALVLCRVKMWGNAGCCEAYSTIAKRLGLGERTVIRAVSVLMSKNLIERKKKGKREKRLYFNFQWTGLPLVDGKSMPERHSEGAGKSADYAKLAQATMPERHTNISSTRQEEIKETVEILADLLTTQKKPISKREFNQRRQLFLNQIDSMK